VQLTVAKAVSGISERRCLKATSRNQGWKKLF